MTNPHTAAARRTRLATYVCAVTVAVPRVQAGLHEVRTRRHAAAKVHVVHAHARVDDIHAHASARRVGQVRVLAVQRCRCARVPPCEALVDAIETPRRAQLLHNVGGRRRQTVPGAQRPLQVPRATQQSRPHLSSAMVHRWIHAQCRGRHNRDDAGQRSDSGDARSVARHAEAVQRRAKVPQQAHALGV